MYRYILPYSTHNDNSQVQGHNDSCDSSHITPLRRSPHYPLTRAIRLGVRHIRTAWHRSLHLRATPPSMSWWD